MTSSYIYNYLVNFHKSFSSDKEEGAIVAAKKTFSRPVEYSHHCHHSDHCPAVASLPQHGAGLRKIQSFHRRKQQPGHRFLRRSCGKKHLCFGAGCIPDHGLSGVLQQHKAYSCDQVCHLSQHPAAAE